MVSAIDYEKIFLEIVANNFGKKVLLHCCCAPCASHCLTRLSGFDVAAYFYNPNIMPLSEYRLRAENMQKLCRLTKIRYIEEEYNNQKFLDIVRGKEDLSEGGSRCTDCFYERLYKTAQKAKTNGFDFFCTTLTLSPHKNSPLINELGLKIENEVGVKYLPSDFKKKGGYQNSIALSKEYGLYRQSYCGCVFK